MNKKLENYLFDLCLDGAALLVRVVIVLFRNGGLALLDRVRFFSDIM